MAGRVDPRSEVSVFGIIQQYTLYANKMNILTVRKYYMCTLYMQCYIVLAHIRTVTVERTDTSKQPGYLVRRTDTCALCFHLYIHTLICSATV